MLFVCVCVRAKLFWCKRGERRLCLTPEVPFNQGRKFRLTVGGDNIHKISQEQFLKGTQIIQLKLFL